MTLNELRYEIAQILSEAKKKKEKAEELKKKGRSIEAYGLYDESFDFSAPLGAYNLYRQQGAVNWGPYTSAGPQIDSSFGNPNVGPKNEQALRSVVRDVIKNGLIPEHSAWAPMMEKQVNTTTWGSAMNLFEAWYDKQSSKDEAKKKSEKTGNYERTKYDSVKKHGVEKKKKRK
jgi:hypothetical protein